MLKASKHETGRKTRHRHVRTPVTDGIDRSGVYAPSLGEVFSPRLLNVRNNLPSRHPKVLRVHIQPCEAPIRGPARSGSAPSQSWPPSGGQTRAWTVTAEGKRPVSFRTRKLSPPAWSLVLWCASPREGGLAVQALRFFSLPRRFMAGLDSRLAGALGPSWDAKSTKAISRAP